MRIDVRGVWVRPGFILGGVEGSWLGYESQTFILVTIWNRMNLAMDFGILSEER